MAEFLTDPSVLTKDKLKSALLAHNVLLPNGDHRKGVYVDLYLKNLTVQNQNRGLTVESFSSDEELADRKRSGRKATKKSDRVQEEEVDVTALTDGDLKEQLLKYNVNVGPIVVSTRKLYEKKLQRLLDQGPPETVVMVSQTVQTDSGRNGNDDSDQYSDKEEETEAAVLEPEPEPEPEPVPVVERPLRSRGKTPVTSRTRSSQNKRGEENVWDDDLHTLNIQRKSRRSSHRLDSTSSAHKDHDVASPSEPELPAVPQQRRRVSAIPRDPNPRLADVVPEPFSQTELSSSPKPAVVPVPSDQDDLHEGVSIEEFYQKVNPSVKRLSARRSSFSNWEQGNKFHKHCSLKLVGVGGAAPAEEPTVSLLNTALIEVGPDSRNVLRSRSLQSVTGVSSQETEMLKIGKRTPPKPSKDLFHAMSRLTPPAGRSKQSLHSPSLIPLTKDLLGSPAATERRVQPNVHLFLSPPRPVLSRDSSFGEHAPGRLIEKSSSVEQNPKTPERNILREMFPNDTLSTPTGISATCRQPIKGAAGRPHGDLWLDDLRPRLTEIKRTSSSSYTESRSVPRLSPSPPAVPLSATRTPVLSSTQPRGKRRLPLWVQLLLVGAVAGFLLFVYQVMESNETSPFGQQDSTALHPAGQ